MCISHIINESVKEYIHEYFGAKSIPTFYFAP